MKKSRNGLMLLCVLLVAMMFTGCGSKGTPATGSSPGGTAGASGVSAPPAAPSADNVLRLRVDADPPSADPKDFNSTRATLAFYSCYDTLLKFSKDGTALEPELAESWEQKDDTTYVYQIKQGVKFSDGSDLTMEDVIFSLNRIKDPATAASMNYLFERVESFEQTGDWELTVRLSEPDATWKYVPATSPCTIVSKAAVEAGGDKYGTAEGGCVGTGPYKFQSWASGSEIVLVPNEYWHGDKSKQIFSKVSISVIADNTAAALAAQSGQLDYVHALSAQTYSIYKNIPAMNFYNYKSTTSAYLAFNTRKAPFDDANFRKAVAYAINKQAITTAIGGEYAHVSGGVPMPDSMFYMDEEAWLKADNETIEDYGYDVEKAKEYLAKSSYPQGTTFNIYTSPARKQTAEAVQADLAAVGITANVVEMQPSETYGIGYGYTLDADGKRVYDLYVTGWLSDYLDPIGYLTPFWSDVNIREGGSNQAEYSNAQVQALIDQSYLETDDKVRSDLMIQAFTLAAQDCPYVTLYDFDETYVLNKKYNYDEGPAFFWNFDLSDFTLAE
jgi:peptide/nickel transport system substrate-binding protein